MKQLLMHMRRSVQKQPSTTLRYAMTTRFRVWDGSHMHEPPHQFLIGSNGSVFKRQEVEPAAPTGPVNAEVMHSTGLTDAEGREVWEGDVLEYTDGSPSHTVVVWNDDALCRHTRNPARTHVLPRSDSFGQAPGVSTGGFSLFELCTRLRLSTKVTFSGVA